MRDPNVDEFQDRVKRIEKGHAKGLGMEAAGTLGRSATYRRPRRQIPIVAPLLVLLVVGIGFKAILLSQIGDVAYAERLVGLQNGEALEKAGAFLMAADPVTTFIAEQITRMGF